MRLYNEDLTKCNFDKSFPPKLMLYPAELQAQKNRLAFKKKQKIGTPSHGVIIYDQVTRKNNKLVIRQFF